MRKVVDGRSVDLTPEEQAEIEADWAAYAPPVPDRISLRQLLLMAKPDWISEAESLAWAARTALPAIVEQVIVTLPLGQQPDARITALTMTEVLRDDRLVGAAAAMLMPSATDAERETAKDTLFREAARR